MCGIAGFLSDSPLNASGEEQRILHAMTKAIAHRGPDSTDTWLDPETGVALGHLRLAILDLSKEGAQPMASACGRFVLIYNGETYNHLSLRQTLAERHPDIRWRGHSDTETLLAGITRWGLESTLRQAHGMFALALWDRQDRSLTLARDRMGEKPLYYGRIGPNWVFGSELKALHPFPGFSRTPDPAAVAAFLQLGYVPEGHCIHAGIHKVAPGTMVTLHAKDPSPTTHAYETFQDIVSKARTARSTQTATTPQDIETTLMQVIDEQMLSDVPLGCFLSGGIDSSLVASLMQAQRARPVQTFAIGFDVARFNEAPHAAEVARHLGTEHTEFILSDRDALNVVPDLPDIYDEPFADSSQIPTALLCREARKMVTVALSGDGGDEVFGGYNRHVLGPDLLRKMQRLPRSVRRGGAWLAQMVGPMAGRENSWARRLASRAGLPVTAVDKITRLAPALRHAEGISDLYAHFIATFPNPSDVMSGAAATWQPSLNLPGDLSDRDWMMAMDSVGYLPGDILVKVDRAAMSTSLETRAPFLDARVIAAAWALPDEARIRQKTGKAVLRDILARHVPTAITERPKQGFAVPVDRWLRGGLKDWGAHLLSNRDLLESLGLETRAAARLWQDHQSERASHGQKLWTLLMLLAWQQNV